MKRQDKGFADGGTGKPEATDITRREGGDLAGKIYLVACSRREMSSLGSLGRRDHLKWWGILGFQARATKKVEGEWSGCDAPIMKDSFELACLALRDREVGPDHSSISTLETWSQASSVPVQTRSLFASFDDIDLTVRSTPPFPCAGKITCTELPIGSRWRRHHQGRCPFTRLI